MEKKFDFEHFERVVARETKGSKWCCDFYSHYDADRNYPFVCVGGYYKECVPYEGNAHLVNTTDPYVEPYEPKDGDFVYYKYYGNEYISIHGKYMGNSYIALCIGEGRCYIGNSFRQNFKERRKATEEEKNLLLSKLHEIGKDWDAEKKELVDYVPPYIPKDGDFVKIHYQNKMGPDNDLVGIYEKSDRNGHNLYCGRWNFTETLWSDAIVEDEWNGSGKADYIIIPATEREKQLLLSELHKDGKTWDAEKKEVVDLKWKPKIGEIVLLISYNYAHGRFIPQEWHYDPSDFRANMYNHGMMFNVKEDVNANHFSDRLNKAIKNAK